MVASETNPYCARLNLPVPRVEDFVARRHVKLIELLVVALLEHGEPISLEAIAERLIAAGARAATGDMAYSLKKAWHGIQPVCRDPDGRMSLNLSSSDLDRFLFRLGLRRPGGEPTPLPTEPEPVPDDVALTEAEVRWAFGNRSIYGISRLRQVAAILDARGQPMSIEGLEAYLSNLTPHRVRLSGTDTGRSAGSCVRMDADGRLWLDRAASDLPAMRHAIRKLARSGQIQEAREQHWQRVSQERETAQARQREEDQQTAARLRPAVLRVVRTRGRPLQQRC